MTSSNWRSATAAAEGVEVVEEEVVVVVEEAAAAAHLQLHQGVAAVAVQDAVVVDRRRLASAAADHRFRPGHDRAEATDRAPGTVRAVANGSAEAAMGAAPDSSVAVMVEGRQSAGAMDQADGMPDRVFATAPASVARGSAIGRVGASVMVVGVTIVDMCASTDVTIRGGREFRSGSTMATTTAIAIG